MSGAGILFFVVLKTKFIGRGWMIDNSLVTKSVRKKRILVKLGSHFDVSVYLLVDDSQHMTTEKTVVAIVLIQF